MRVSATAVQLEHHPRSGTFSYLSLERQDQRFYARENDATWRVGFLNEAWGVLRCFDFILMIAKIDSIGGARCDPDISRAAQAFAAIYGLWITLLIVSPSDTPPKAPSSLIPH